MIPLLNDYADAIVSAIHEAGGDVLKLIGDGVLAIFRDDDPGRACHAALAGRAPRRVTRVADLNPRRIAESQPEDRGLCRPSCRRGLLRQYRQRGPPRLHRRRPCRQRDQPHRRHVPLGRPAVLLSSAFHAAAAPEDRARLVSIGRYALRGVARPQELFTRDVSTSM